MPPFATLTLVGLQGTAWYIRTEYFDAYIHTYLLFDLENRQTYNISLNFVAIKLLIIQTWLEHRLSALLQPHLHSRLNILLLLDWAKATARRDEKYLSFGIWCGLYERYHAMRWNREGILNRNETSCLPLIWPGFELGRLRNQVSSKLNPLTNRPIYWGPSRNLNSTTHPNDALYPQQDKAQPNGTYFITVTSLWARWCLKSPAQ